MSLALASLMPPTLPLLPHAAAAAAAAAFLPYQQAAAVCPAGPSGHPRPPLAPPRAPRPSAFTVEELLKDKRSTSPGEEEADVPAIVSSLYGPAPLHLSLHADRTPHVPIPFPRAAPHIRASTLRRPHSPSLSLENPQQSPALSPPAKTTFQRSIVPASPSISPSNPTRASRSTSPKMFPLQSSSASPSLSNRLTPSPSRPQSPRLPLALPPHSSSSVSQSSPPIYSFHTTLSSSIPQHVRVKRLSDTKVRIITPSSQH